VAANKIADPSLDLLGKGFPLAHAAAQAHTLADVCLTVVSYATDCRMLLTFVLRSKLWNLIGAPHTLKFPTAFYIYFIELFTKVVNK
jgi:hypothetical protein